MPGPPARHPALHAGPPVRWPELARILVVRPDNLGDVVLLSPALRALRAAAPDAAIELLAAPAGAAVAPLLPEVDRVLTVRPVWQDAAGALPLDPVRELELVDRVRGGGYDAMVVFTSFSQSPWPAAYLGYLAGVSARVGQSREFGGSLLTHWVAPPPDEGHQVDRALHLLAAVGVPPAGPELSLWVPDTARTAAHRAATRAGLPAGAGYAVLAPGTSCSARRYPADRFGAVAGLLAAAGLPVAVVGSDREAPLVEAVLRAGAGAPRRTGGVVGLAGVLDVPGMAALIEGAAVTVTNNSGGMHLADALRRPLVALFAGTELESQYRPRGTRAVLLRRPTACTPCRAFVCPYAQECLDVPAGAVAGAALDLLDR